MAKGVPKVTWMWEWEPGVEHRLSVSQSSSDTEEHQVQGCSNFPNSVFPFTSISKRLAERKLYQGRGSWATIMQESLPCSPQTGIRPKRNEGPEKLRESYKEGVRPSPETPKYNKGAVGVGARGRLRSPEHWKRRILFSSMKNKKNYESIK